MIQRLLFILSFLFCLSYYASAQRHCGTDHVHQQQKNQNTELYQQQEKFKEELNQILENNNKKGLKLSAATDTFKIPVVVHVIYNGIASTNISDAQVLSQIEVLNEDFRRKPGTPGFNANPVGADVQIEFCLANSDPSGNVTTGIVRKFHARTDWSSDFSDEVLLKSLSYWPSDQYLNIWVCRLDGDVLGYAQYPTGAPLPGPGGGSAEIDGVVIDYRAFGRVGTAGSGAFGLYGEGRTTTHEVGHWLGLLHIWGNGCTTDYVDDTPIDAAANEDADCTDASDCDGNMVFTPDMTNNYLDYSPDVCMNIFTQGQKARMRTVMENAPRRVSLLTSMGCCIPFNAEKLPLKEGFEEAAHPNWKVIADISPNWTVSTPGAYGTSDNSIQLNNDVAGVGEVDYLESEYVLLKYQKPAVEFDLAYALNASAVSDCLVVSFSLNCLNWTPIFTLHGNSLSTTSRITDNFIPLAGEWKRFRIDLEPLNDKTVGRIRFANYSKGINTLYLDNIDLHKTSNSLIVTPYPTPTTGELYVEVINEDPDDIHYELFDMLGQKIWKETDFQKTTYVKTIQLSGIARGMYILRVSDSKQRASRKILYSY